MNDKVKIFNKIETRYNLYYEKIYGINYWMYSRFDIWNYIQSVSEESLGALQNQPKGLAFKVKAGFGLLSTLLFGRKIQKKEIDILFLNHERKVMVDGKYECKYTEAISRLYENSYILERPYEMSHLKPTDQKKLIYLDGIAIKGNLRYHLEKRFHKMRYEQLLKTIGKKLEAPIHELEQELQISLDHKHMIDIVAKRTLICQGKYKEYEKLFRKVHPKMIVEVVHYNMDCMIVNEIAKREGIRTVELQHGNIYPMHIAYQYAYTESLKQLPEEIWLLSDYWKEDIHLPIEKEKLIPVGFPYYENRVKEYKEQYHRTLDRKTVLFVSQGTIGKQLSEFAAEFAKRCDNDKYKILFKLHPGELPIWKEQYKELVQCENIEVIDNRDIEIYQLFAESDIQVGVYSTAIYEGIGFELDTYICDLPYATEMQPLLDQGYAMLVKTPEELKLVIEKEKSERIQKEFWTRDSLNNIKTQIDRILKER